MKRLPGRGTGQKGDAGRSFRAAIDSFSPAGEEPIHHFRDLSFPRLIHSAILKEEKRASEHGPVGPT